MDNELKLSLENLPDLNNNLCHYCHESLSPLNESAWRQFDVINGQQVTVRQCVICYEANSRLLDSCIKDGDSFIPQRTFEDCRNEVCQQQVSCEALKQFELISTTQDS